MNKFKVDILEFNELPQEVIDEYDLEKDDYDWTNYIVATYNDEVILLQHDRMEPEDATFSRDLNWIASALEHAYELGKSENNEC